MGGRTKKQQQAFERAYQLFVETDMTQRAIAEMVGVGERTISAWVTDHDWRKDRAANTVTRPKIIRAFYSQIDEINQVIAEREEGKRYPQPKEADTIIKIQKAISALDKRYDLPTYKTVLDEFVGWLHMHHPKVASEVALPSVDFLRQKMEHLTHAN